MNSKNSEIRFQILEEIEAVTHLIPEQTYIKIAELLKGIEVADYGRFNELMKQSKGVIEIVDDIVDDYIAERDLEIAELQRERILLNSAILKAKYNRNNLESFMRPEPVLYIRNPDTGRIVKRDSKTGKRIMKDLEILIS